MKELTPICVAFRDKHPRVADGEDLDFVLCRLVHDAIRSAENLAETICIGRNGLKTFVGNRSSNVRKPGEWSNCIAHSVIPSDGVFR